LGVFNTKNYKNMSRKTEIKDENYDLVVLEERKVRALEKIAVSLDALTLWFEEVDKDEWGDRIQYYLSQFHKLVPKDE
jgi:hypothetical protein